MSRRRSRAPVARPSRPPEVIPAAPATPAVTPEPARRADSTETAQLRALEVGWDELLA